MTKKRKKRKKTPIVSVFSFNLPPDCLKPPLIFVDGKWKDRLKKLMELSDS